MNAHAFEITIAVLFLCAAGQAAARGDWPYVAYGLAAAVLQVAVVAMGK